MNIDSILQKIGLRYDDLNSDEKETLSTWMVALQQNKVTVGTVSDYIRQMKDSVEKELTMTGLNSKQDLFLKARLRNYILLEAFLTSPEKAKEAIERSLSSMIPRQAVK